MKRILFFVWPLLCLQAEAQKLGKADKQILYNLQQHISYLANDKLEGRRTGTEGEKLAMEYIRNAFEKNGLQPKGTEGYYQPFEVNEGRQVLPSSLLMINGELLQLHKDYFPMPWSPDASDEHVVSPALSESGQPWFWDLQDVLAENSQNPHFNVSEAIQQKAKDAAAKGATVLYVYNKGNREDGLKYDPRDRSPLSSIPVVYLQKAVMHRLMQDLTLPVEIKLRLQQGEKIRKGYNVVGFIDNGAPATVVLGAHFDHLGWGEDQNSRHSGEPAIHNGADDNASGTAALIELSRLLKKNGPNNHNYLFIAFSGEELGLYGSRHFTENPTIDLTQVNYMINMDMVGRLNDSSKTITIGGFGTSPVWQKVLFADKKLPFTIKTDSSGTGPSDHTSFYRKNIPVLFFFTGLHSDYHKPSDDFDKINYTGTTYIVQYIRRLIDRTNNYGKLAFLKTREQQTTTTARFSVSMGIMPDYTYSGAGVKVDGVSEGKPAQKAGILAGDVVIKLGDFNITSVESYMQALSKFKKGDSTRVKVKRGTQELEMEITF